MTGRLRCYMNLMALEGLPQSADPFRAVKEAGYDGVQFAEPATPEQIALCEELGLGRAGLGRVNHPADAASLAERLAAEGQECGTVHLGWGMEDDDEAARLIEALLDASERYRLPLYPETHRATIFQDIWRTVQFVTRFPALRFNGDFSHWYTGLEMVYGGFDRKAEFLRPVLERIRFLHGRIGSPGSIQVDIGDGDVRLHPYVAHFRTLWTAAFEGFLRGARQEEFICFAPELLAARIYYARTFPGPDGAILEESDRWAQSFVLCRIARECFREAAQLSGA